MDTLKKNNIPFEEVSLASSSGRIIFRDLNKEYGGKFEKEKVGGVNFIKMPLIIDKGSEIKTYQGKEGLERVLKYENITIS
ncbi:MAG: hypothetical protein KKA64_04495 [Nanoarchaeota archaeon]|nr:hypothetical protein [Nanoarchaeota archaeon]